MNETSELPDWLDTRDTLASFAARLDQPVCFKDLDCRYVYANEAALRAVDLFGGAPVAGERLSTLCPLPESARIERNDRAVMESGQTQVAEESFNAAGYSRHYLATRVALRDASGRVRGLACLWVERRAPAGEAATGHPPPGERERLLAAERSARDRAETALQVRDRFLAVAAHDLRSPLNGIQNWANVLEKQMSTESPPLMRRALGGIRSAIDQQVQLIEDLLDATRIMSGRLSLSVSTQALLPLVRAAIDNVAEAAALRAVAIVADFAGNAGEAVRGDPHRLQQIVRKLLSNAIGFSPPEGAVRVTLERDGGTLRLCVRDQGPGVDSAALPNLLAWADIDGAAGPRHRDGVVMGLALVRRLVELHGGQLDAFSGDRGAGARFELRLPLALPMTDGPIAGSPASATLAGLRVMVIDDRPESCEKLTDVLSKMQAHAYCVETPDQALAQLDAGGAHSFDALLCDLDMPTQGTDLLPLRLRALEDRLGVQEAQRLPLIAFTAFGDAARERLRNAGFTAHLSKPASMAAIGRALAAVTGHDRAKP